MCTFSVLYNYSIHYFPGKKNWISVSILKLIEVCFHLNFFVNAIYPEIPV